jgi:hypothetical protein
MRGAFIHQIYAIIHNKTNVDTALNDLKSKRALKIFYCPILTASPSESQFFVMTLKGYTDDISSLAEKAEEKNPAISLALLKFMAWARHLSDHSSVHKEDFKIEFSNVSCLHDVSPAASSPLSSNHLQGA